MPGSVTISQFTFQIIGGGGNCDWSWISGLVQEKSLLGFSSWKGDEVLRMERVGVVSLLVI